MFMDTEVRTRGSGIPKTVISPGQIQYNVRKILSVHEPGNIHANDFSERLARRIGGRGITGTDFHFEWKEALRQIPGADAEALDAIDRHFDKCISAIAPGMLSEAMAVRAANAARRQTVS